MFNPLFTMGGFNYAEPNLDPPEYPDPVCPVCGSRECFTFFKKDGEIIGCEDCVTTCDAYYIYADDDERDDYYYDDKDDDKEDDDNGEYL